MTVSSGPLRVGIIGAGRIGSLLARATARYAPSVLLSVASRNRARCATLQRDVPTLTIAEPEDLAAHVDIVILAVPPDAYLDLLGSLAPRLAADCVLVSLTNGIALERLAALVANPIVKAIPTMAHLVGRGASLVMAGPHAEARHVDRVVGFFSAFSRPLVIDDRDARVASNAAGCFLALAAAFTDAFVEANAKRTITLDRPNLDAMAAEALGAVADLAAAGHRFSEIAAATATPGGPTEAALDALLRSVAPLAGEIVEATFRRQAEQQIQATAESATR